MPTDYRSLNRASWDERAPAHAASPDYALGRFAADPRYLSDVVTFDLPRLGSVAGLRGVHLQCHIGTDTVSLARLGARMTGLDFSPAALVEARHVSPSFQRARTSTSTKPTSTSRAGGARSEAFSISCSRA